MRARVNNFTYEFRSHSMDHTESILPDLHNQACEIRVETLRQVPTDEAKAAEAPTTLEKRKNGESKPTKIKTSSHLLHMLRTTPERAQQH